MIDLDALTWVLPAHRIQTDEIARVTGNRHDRPLVMWVPPAGWLAPAIEPEPAIEFVLAEAGWPALDAQRVGRELGTCLLQSFPVQQRPILIDDRGSFRCCTSIHHMAEALASLGDQERRVANAIMRCGERLARAKVIGGDSLQGLAAGPPACAWTEAWFDLGSELVAVTGGAVVGAHATSGSAEVWLAEIMPIAKKIAEAIGGPVLHPPGDRAGNGYHYHGDIHRWLMLDFACFQIPKSPFVACLVEASKASSLEELRETLHTPSSYSADYRLVDAFEKYPSVNRQDLRLDEDA